MELVVLGHGLDVRKEKSKDDIQVSGLGALLDGSVLDDEVTAEREGPVGQEWICHQGLGAHWEDLVIWELTAYS